MELSAEQVRSWVESWSWRIPRGPQHGGMSGDMREWWSLTIWRRAAQVELHLDVNCIREPHGSTVHNFVKEVSHETLRAAEDYRTLVATLNDALWELFSAAGIEPPRLPDGSLSGDTHGGGVAI
jgi:hypothetical protein